MDVTGAETIAIVTEIGIPMSIGMVIVVVARHVMIGTIIVAVVVTMIIACAPLFVAAMIVAIEVTVAILEVRSVDACFGTERRAPAEMTATEVATAKVAATEMPAAASLHSGCRQSERENRCASEQRRDRTSSHDVPS